MPHRPAPGEDYLLVRHTVLGLGFKLFILDAGAQHIATAQCVSFLAGNLDVYRPADAQEPSLRIYSHSALGYGMSYTIEHAANDPRLELRKQGGYFAPDLWHVCAPDGTIIAASHHELDGCLSRFRRTGNRIYTLTDAANDAPIATFRRHNGIFIAYTMGVAIHARDHRLLDDWAVLAIACALASVARRRETRSGGAGGGGA